METHGLAAKMIAKLLKIARNCESSASPGRVFGPSILTPSAALRTRRPQLVEKAAHAVPRRVILRLLCRVGLRRVGERWLRQRHLSNQGISFDFALKNQGWPNSRSPHEYNEFRIVFRLRFGRSVIMQRRHKHLVHGLV